MQTFKVYPKEGKMLTLEFESFELKDGRFTLIAADNPSDDGLPAPTKGTPAVMRVRKTRSLKFLCLRSSGYRSEGK